MTTPTLKLPTLIGIAILLVGISRIASGQSNEIDYKYTITVHSTLPPYTFHLIVNEDKSEVGAVHSVSRIEIRRSDKPGIFQILKKFKTYHPYWEGAFVAKDLNFDGYLDLMLEYDWGSGGRWSHVWLFSPKTKKFIYHDELSKLSTLEPDSPTRTLTTVEQSGACCGTNCVYHFVKGKLDQISEENTWFDERIHRSIRETKLFQKRKVVSVTVDTLAE